MLFVSFVFLFLFVFCVLCFVCVFLFFLYLKFFLRFDVEKKNVGEKRVKKFNIGKKMGHIF